MEGLPARADIDVRCRRITRRRGKIESSIRRRDRRRIIREWALHRQDGIFGMDNGSGKAFQQPTELELDAGGLGVEVAKVNIANLS